MRKPLLAAVLLVSAAAPALAQSREPVERRVDRIEKELRAVQRKVFPNGAGVTLEPEIAPQQQTAPLAGVPASSALSDLTARVDALEAQIRNLTRQTEENDYRIRQLQTDFTQFRAEAERWAAERAQQTAQAQPPAPDASEQPAEATAPAADAPSTGDPGEDAYLTGFRLWDAGRYADAQKALAAMIKQYPKHARTSFARNLLGRALLDEGKPAAAAKEFLANYQADPKGERAPDSLYFLGQALVQLKKPADACKVYDELQDVYGASMRDWVKQRLPKARQDAKCA